MTDKYQNIFFIFINHLCYINHLYFAIHDDSFCVKFYVIFNFTKAVVIWSSLKSYFSLVNASGVENWPSNILS